MIDKSANALAAGDLTGVLERLERYRRKVLRGYWKTVAWLVLGTGLVISACAVSIYVLHNGIWQTQLRPYAELIVLALVSLPAVWLLGAVWVFRHCAHLPKWRYLNRYKSEAFTEICALHFPGLRYQPAAGIPYKLFDGSRLFPWTSDVYSSEDRFTGKTGKTAVTFAEVRAERKRRRLTSEGIETEYEEYFRGLMLIADFHKHFHSSVRVLPASEEFVTLPSEERVVTEDADFERLFLVLGTDQTDARYVLSTSMLRRIWALGRRFGQVRLGFRHEQLILLLPRGRDQFEPSLYRKAGSPGQIQQFVDDVGAALGLVNELDLNTRIWSKRQCST